MSLQVQCECGSVYRLDDSRAGQSIPCRVCSATIQIPLLQVHNTTDWRDPAEAKQAAQPANASNASSPSPPNAPAAVMPLPCDPSHQPRGDFGQSLFVPTDTAQAPPPPKALGDEHADGPQVGPQRPATGLQTPPRGSAIQRHPPGMWWITRGLMLGMCVGFLFGPWLTMTAGPVRGGNGPDNVSVSGWQMVRATVEGVRAATSMDGQTFSGIPTPELPDGMGTIAAGAVMMIGGPFVYAAGLLLTAVVAIIAYKTDGRGAMWPFILCGAGALAFIIGWWVISGSEPVSMALSAAEAAGAEIGVSGWLYLMALMVCPMCLVARLRPARLLENMVA